MSRESHISHYYNRCSFYEKIVHIISNLLFRNTKANYLDIASYAEVMLYAKLGAADKSLCFRSRPRGMDFGKHCLNSTLVHPSVGTYSSLETCCLLSHVGITQLPSAHLRKPGAPANACVGQQLRPRPVPSPACRVRAPSGSSSRCDRPSRACTGESCRLPRLPTGCGRRDSAGVEPSRSRWSVGDIFPPPDGQH